MHREVKLRIVALDRRHEGLGCNRHLELLLDLAHDGGLGRFAGLHLAAGKLPPVLEVAVPALGGENPAFMLDDGRDHFDRLHSYSLLF